MPTNNPTARFKQNIIASPDLTPNFRDNLVWLSEHLAKLDKANERIEVEFSGPSVYFHQKAIAAASEGKFFSKKKQDRLGQLELIYAVLPAWGMHRMGDTNTKLKDFIPFVNSIERVYDDLDALQQVYEGKTIADAPDEDIEKIRNLMFEIHVSTSKSLVVSYFGGRFFGSSERGGDQ